MNKKKQPGKNLILFLASLLVILCLECIISVPCFASSIHIGGKGGVTPGSEPGTYDGITDEPLFDGQLPMPDIEVISSGDPNIYYDLLITYLGDAMRFEYDYGDYWNPSTHSYMRGATGRQFGGWVEDGYINYTNNAITITNRSNFPMDANISYANDPSHPMNANPNASQSVVGIFSTIPGTFTASVLDEGKDGAHEVSSLDLNLAMDSNVASGGFYYRHPAPLPANYNKEQQVYFALSGRPDPGFSREFTHVGTITVTISPAQGVQRVDVP